MTARLVARPSIVALIHTRKKLTSQWGNVTRPTQRRPTNTILGRRGRHHGRKRDTPPALLVSKNKVSEIHGGLCRRQSQTSRGRRHGMILDADHRSRDLNVVLRPAIRYVVTLSARQIKDSPSHESHRGDNQSQKCQTAAQPQELVSCPHHVCMRPSHPPKIK